MVCTLAGDEEETRHLEWGDVAPLAVMRRRIEGGIESTFPIEMADAVEDLANREMECCGSWLDIKTTRTSDLIRLEMTTANTDGVAILVSLAGISDGH